MGKSSKRGGASLAKSATMKEKGGRGGKGVGKEELDALDKQIRDLRNDLKLQDAKVKFLLD